MSSSKRKVIELSDERRDQICRRLQDEGAYGIDGLAVVRQLTDGSDDVISRDTTELVE